MNDRFIVHIREELHPYIDEFAEALHFSREQTVNVVLALTMRNLRSVDLIPLMLDRLLAPYAEWNMWMKIEEDERRRRECHAPQK
jgi:hypothetical protein